MTRKIISAILVLLFLAAFLTACDSASTSTATQTAAQPSAINPTPDSGIEGYYGCCQTVSGGQHAQDANIKSVTAETVGEDTVISISFIYGSKYSDVDEAKIDMVPSYEVSGVASPSRLAVAFDGIDFWDWENRVDQSLSSGIFHGAFSKLPYDDSPYMLVFQLNEGVAYSVEENDDVLIIRLRSIGQSDKKFCVALDAFYEYQEGKIPDVWGFTPSLCSDLSSKILLTDAMDTMQEAEMLLAQISAEMSNISPELFTVVEVSDNDLPSIQVQGLSAYQVPIVKVNGVEKHLDIAMANGAYQTSSPDGKTSLFSAPVDGNMDYEFLWKKDHSGKLQKLWDYEFYTITKAEFSPDGSRLCVRDMSRDGYSIYCLSADQQELIDFRLDGIGSYITNFAWHENSQILYIIDEAEMQVEDENGEMETFVVNQLISYDLSKDYGERITVLMDSGMCDSELDFYKGGLYFTLEDDYGEESIVRYDAQTGVISTLAQGFGFKLSAGGKMAVLKYEQNNTDSYGYQISVLDVNTQDITILEEFAIVTEFHWSLDGNKLYYMKYSGEDEAFYYVLCSYDVQSGRVAEILSSATSYFYTTHVANQIMFVDYVYGENTKTVTYSLDLTKI